MIDYSQLFKDGIDVHSGLGKATLRCRNIADLIVTSGRIVACDPLVSPETPPFTIELPPNSYPVILNVAYFGNQDQRVAYAMLKASDQNPVRWEMALLPDQDMSSLKEGHIFCYGVDSGTGCFMDAEAAQGLMEKMDADEDYFDTLIDEMDKTYVHTWSWANVEMSAATNANLVAFSSGLGDGCYASYFGFDDHGNVVCLVTDFGLFEDAEISNALKPHLTTH